MKLSLFTTALAASIISVSAIPFTKHSPTSSAVSKRQTGCENTATSRGCWGSYSIDDDFLTVLPRTGVTREYWLSVENTTAAPDGYERSVLSFNGTVPGPAITADWGDEVVIHVTNNLDHNGTAIHWHGIRQLNTNEFDGVPGVTQCPIAPGDSFTYKFHADHYGTTWYHSHFTLQYGDGLLGPLVINGPATADYDEDLGVVFLSDWSHQSAFELWSTTASRGAPPSLDTGLINGLNTFDCSGSTDEKCLGTGKKFELNFEAGKKYRIRLINSAIDGHFQFSLDGHSFQVIAMDLVPIVPYEAESLHISIGQRYDIVVEANADPGDYWLRAGWQSACNNNQNADGMTGIIRYDNTSTADPTSTGITVDTFCGDEDASTLVPHVPLNVGNYSSMTVESLGFTFGSYFEWTVNSSSLVLDWENPTNLMILNDESIWPTEYNVIPIEAASESDWAVFVIQDRTGFGITHPIHLHGHDFWIIAQEYTSYDSANPNFNFVNPPRRDVASLPGNGYLAIAFEIDNPGSWIMHCHIAWHASQGFALQFVESESQIVSTFADETGFQDTCTNWNSYTTVQLYEQDDSGI
ncbi:laccase from botrytis Aclada At 1.67 A resolution [Bisporella sp. PMI_857]|nr:laccase from botrytis Aclada At 1.67 A resolution [Bisporella sp. PMI_857]